MSGGKMYKGTYQKIEKNATYLKRICAQGKLENFELFDEPYKMAIEVLNCSHMDEESCARHLGINKETVKQVRSALGV
jgi:hypothetical protein